LEAVIASELLSSIISPIAEDNPFGENINYDPDFDALKSEMGKLGNIDYELVEEKSHTLLKEKSKDVRVLSFLSFVYLRNESWEFFSDIFDGLTQLAEKDYDGLFPDRPRAKQMAFKWLSEQRFVDVLATKKPTESVYEHTQRLVESLTKLKTILEEKFPEGSPFPAGLLSAAQKWEKATKPKPKPEPAAAAQPAAPGAPAAAGTAAPSAAPAAQAAPMETPKDAQTEGRKVALFLIENEPEKPMGYRLLRSLRWDLVEKAPPAEGGKTRLEPPPAERKTFLQNLIGKEEWQQALITAEKAFSSGPTHYWLDLQRISASACTNLGKSYDAIHEAICLETALFLKRVPEIQELSFSDGSPFCDEATKDWIGSDVSAVLSSSKGAVSQGKSAKDDPLSEEKKEINALVSKGKTEEAIEILQEKIHESGSERINFKRSLLLCNLLFSVKHAHVALAILESLHEKIDKYNLDKWEPDLAIETWSLQARAYKIVGSSKSQNMQVALQEKQNSILSRLSVLDPKSALKLNI
jgi:type VI secretion system protein VasJ